MHYDLYAGMRVRYVPNHALGDIHHPDCEDGVVTSFSAEWKANEPAARCTAFVRYNNKDGSPQPNSKATSVEDLVAI